MICVNSILTSILEDKDCFKGEVLISARSIGRHEKDFLFVYVKFSVSFSVKTLCAVSITNC